MFAFFIIDLFGTVCKKKFLEAIEILKYQ